MTAVWVSPEDRTRIRHAIRNRCQATGEHDGHLHVCDGSGDHGGFGDDLPHTALCAGRVFAWKGKP